MAAQTPGPAAPEKTARYGLGRRIGFAIESGAMTAVQKLTRLASLDSALNFAGRLGAFVVSKLPITRKRILKNIDLVHPEWDAQTRERICREVGDNFARVALEYDRMEELARTDGLMDIEGGEHLQEAAAAGKGVILVTAHYGNWEFIRLAARQLGAPSAIIYRAFNNPVFDARAQAMIAEAGTPVLHKGRQGSRALLKHVAKGGVALILIDQRQTGSPLIPFLGHEAETATAAAELARRFGAALIPARARRLPGGRRFHVRFESPIPQGDAVEMTAAANEAIGRWIDEDPGQWFWLHRRWKLRDRGKRIRALAEEA